MGISQVLVGQGSMGGGFLARSRPTRRSKRLRERPRLLPDPLRLGSGPCLLPRQISPQVVNGRCRGTSRWNRNRLLAIGARDLLASQVRRCIELLTTTTGDDKFWGGNVCPGNLRRSRLGNGGSGRRWRRRSRNGNHRAARGASGALAGKLRRRRKTLSTLAGDLDRHG
jgi:hypothetical protein